GGTEEIPKDALDDEREAERQQQPVKMIEVLQALEEQALDDHAEDADNDRRDDNRPPVAEPQVLQQEKRREGTHHVLGAVGEVDHIQHPEEDREPEAKQGVERAVDQSEQQLTEQRLRWNAEDLEHDVLARLTTRSDRLSPRRSREPSAVRRQPLPAPFLRAAVAYPLTSGQPPSLSGRNASAAGIVARNL